MRKAVTLLCIAALLPLLLQVAARAQPGFDMKIFPSKLELSGEPGTTQDFVINVQNLGAADQKMRVYFNDYMIKADNEFIFKEPGHYSYSCGKWLSTDGSNLLVPAGQTVQKSFKLAVPPRAEPGGHYAVVFFEQLEAAGKEITAKGRIGVVTLVTVPGKIIREGDIKKVSVTSTWFWPTRKVPLLPTKRIHCRVVFYNSGNVHLTVKGKAVYTPTFGWGAGTVDLGEITVLPRTTRYLEADIKKPPFLGSYEVKAEVSYGPSLDVFDTTRTKESSFNIYPLSLLLLLLVLIAVIIGVVKLVKWLRKRRGKGHRGGKHRQARGAGRRRRGQADKPSTDKADAAGDAGEEAPGGESERLEEDQHPMLSEDETAK